MICVRFASDLRQMNHVFKPSKDYLDMAKTEEKDIKTVEKWGKKFGERLVDGLVDGLVESQKEILRLISLNPKISKQQLSNKIKISTTAIDKNISKLKKKGLLKRIGPAKGGYWKILEK